MLAKISSKHQVVIPAEICALFGLVKGDLVDFKISGKRIILEPKEFILKDKYPKAHLKAAHKALAQGKAGKEIAFKSGDEMVKYFKKRTNL